MKITPGSVADDGVFKLSESFDGIGVMARDPTDLAALTEVLLTLEASRQAAQGGGYYSAASENGWKGLRIGVVGSTWGLCGDAAKRK